VSYYLGIDGGGTKTTCAVGDDSRLLTTATAGASNIVRVGETQARESLRKSVMQACVAAGIVPSDVSRVCVGGSGAAHPELAAVVRSMVGETVSCPVDVVGDMEVALEAAFDTGPGVIVIAGTGSIAYGRDDRGKTARAGGFGFAIGDEGSAHWIGRTAVNSVLRASDSSDDAGESSLAKALFKLWGVTSLMDLARAANSIPPPDFAALSPAVFASEDVIAGEVLRRAGRELANIAAVVIERLFPRESVDAVPVAMTGGVFRHAAMVREAFYNELCALESRAQVITQVVDPVEGALRLARRAGGMGK